jgi:MFS family permease
MALGTVISLPFSGILASVGGWESVFYVEGGLALIWCVLWLLFIYDSPEEHPRINSEELNLFKSYCGDDNRENLDPAIETKIEKEETNCEVFTSTRYLSGETAAKENKKTWCNKKGKPHSV